MFKLSSWKAIYLLCVFCAIAAVSSPAQTFKTLVNFNGSDGSSPFYVSLVQGTDGNLYGTTATGGAHDAGTVFKVTPAGTLTTLYSFCSQTNCTDGQYPEAGLVLGTDGNFYGTTEFGGSNSCTFQGTVLTCGTVFSITSGGKLTTLHSFDGTNGANPTGALIQATNGKLYGTTYYGGASDVGTVFSITSAGTLTTLHNFAGYPTDGASPSAGLVQATNGDFYGTTVAGGANTAGTVFSITSGGTVAVLHSFDGTDGYIPVAGLVQATNGNFYGTTYYGGDSTNCTDGCGTVFEITPGGTLTTLHYFAGHPTDGAYPSGTLVQATNGIFYGTTYYGGANKDGTVFSVTSGGTLTTLHSFDGTDGENEDGGLVQATNGTLYGTARFGGANDEGTIFSEAVGLGPFVEMNPTSGAVGTKVTILGNNLTGSTSVTFNSKVAKFTVNSTGTAITATVPTGATTGYVKVTTPSHTLTSNVKFRIP
jgi:uncharacterized repeat protein (TIGR03803 family)